MEQIVELYEPQTITGKGNRFDSKDLSFIKTLRYVESPAPESPKKFSQREAKVFTPKGSLAGTPKPNGKADPTPREDRSATSQTNPLPGIRQGSRTSSRDTITNDLPVNIDDMGDKTRVRTPRTKSTRAQPKERENSASYGRPPQLEAAIRTEKKPPSQKPIEEAILCPMCQEILRIPKFLICLHNICKRCLNGHIGKTVDKRGPTKAPALTYNCPVCDTKCPAPEQSKDPDRWADLLPRNFFLDTYTRVLSAKNGTSICDPCERRRERILANSWCTECCEFFCDNCMNVHGGFEQFLNHSVLTVEQVKDNGDEALPRYEICHEHKDKITLFCIDHQAPCCTNCVARKHRKCENVVTVEEEFRVLNGKGEFSHLSKLLKEYTTTSADQLANRKRLMHELELKKFEIVGKIRTIRQNVEETFRDLEEKILASFSSFHRTEMDKLKVQTTNCDNIHKAISNASILFDTYQEEGCEAQLLALSTKVRIECEKYESTLTDIQKRLEKVDYSFTVDKTVEDLLKGVRQLGTINVTRSSDKVPQITANPFKKGIAREIGKIRVWLPGDRGHCNITSGIYLDDSRLLLVDYDNFKIKLFSEKGRVLGKLSLQEKPSDITMIDEENFAMTIPSSNSVQFISLNGNTILEGKTIEMAKMYHGLAYYGNKLYMVSSTGITICSIDGTEIQTIKPNKAGDPISLSPAYIKVSNETIFVSDHEKNCLTALTPQGALLYAYTAEDLIYPVGVDTDNQGNVYICCKNSLCVQQLSPDGTRVKNILTERDKMENPLAIGFHRFRNKFFITEAKGLNKDYIRIFQLV
ncbi:hypothetical protein ACJMK2_010935 [Sinanodonta woodiana]|uniref:Uncharacterized protein n=1 Tax=Sinanodonta woodiana TaxID=1069815 RepID=A0ABD3V6K1_SINWO